MKPSSNSHAQDSIYEADVNNVIEVERGYITRRRKKIADEFLKLKGAAWYANLLQDDGRPLVGMAFSGGGIRSATFNLGLAQGLSRFGILPWVDYLSSVSGGGYIAACMNSLLGYEEKKLELGDTWNGRYYPFNTHWERFPFNPGLQVFDETGAAYTVPLFNKNTLNPKFKPANKEEEKLFESLQNATPGEVNLDLKKSDGANRNRQLEHLRKLGNYLIPRLGAFTLDTMRGLVGAVLLRVGYTFLAYFLVMLIIGLGHYAVTAAFMPEITQNYDLKTAIQDTTPPAPVAEDAEDAEEAEDEIPISAMFGFAFGQYDEKILFTPWVEYGVVFSFGLVHTIGLAILLSLCYRKDVTTDNRLMDWKSPAPHISLYSYLVIKGIKWVFALILLAMSAMSAWLIYNEWQGISPSPAEIRTMINTGILLGLLCLSAFFYFLIVRSDGKTIGQIITRAVYFLIGFVVIPIATGVIVYNQLQIDLTFQKDVNLIFATIFLFFLYFVMSVGFLLHTESDWTKQGLQENEFIDWLVILSFILITLWSMSLALFSLRFSNFINDGELNLFWLWMPAIFLVGGMMGLAFLQSTQLFQNLPPLDRIFSKRVVSPKNMKYDDKSIGRLMRLYMQFLGVKDNRDLPDRSKFIRKSRGVDYKFKIWSIPEFRSIFWTLQGILFYGVLGFAALALIALPNFFAGISSVQSTAAVPLSAAVFSALWAYLQSSGKGGKIWESLPKLFSLPGEIYRAILAILVIVLNLSILFLIVSAIDRWLAIPSFMQNAALLIAALLVFGITGFFVNANYLSAHYFYRDRIGEAYFQTSVDHRDGYVHIVRDDRSRRMSSTLNPECSAPYHLVMAAINMSGSWHLKYKDRQSQPFIYSRDFCGSDITGYTRMKQYHSDGTKYSQAIALSGAAVSSGIGYLTFFAQAFLVTLFNLRLGLWLTNPKLYASTDGIKKARNVEEFNFWHRYLWNEARGRMSERDPLVNITDGAHTGDNIGLYPLFQRRCKYIIAGDAGEDPHGYCTELFSVLRQVEIDFGVKVDINVDGLAPEAYDKQAKTASKSKSHFAIGKITYPPTDGDEEMEGWLIYFRPSVVEGDPAQIAKYWERHKLDFPHPSTADQFFDDEQFEVTRMLGEWTVESAVREIYNTFNIKPAKAAARKRPTPRDLHHQFVNAWITAKKDSFSFETGSKPADKKILNNLHDLLTAYCKYQDEKNSKAGAK